MKLSLLIVGKTDFSFIEDGMKMYINRINKYNNFSLQILKNCNEEGNVANRIKTKEGETILNVIKPNDYVVLLDEHGQMMRSIMFSEYLGKKIDSGLKQLVFVIGGAYGFSDEVHQRANDKLSLSKLTFSHQLVRLVFLEQLYRAFSIIRHEPYHHE